jgi:hypothetical protein
MDFLKFSLINCKAMTSDYLSMFVGVLQSAGQLLNRSIANVECMRAYVTTRAPKFQVRWSTFVGL